MFLTQNESQKFVIIHAFYENLLAQIMIDCRKEAYFMVNRELMQF